jgi:hypothetical protein
MPPLISHYAALFRYYAISFDIACDAASPFFATPPRFSADAAIAPTCFSLFVFFHCFFAAVISAPRCRHARQMFSFARYFDLQLCFSLTPASLPDACFILRR